MTITEILDLIYKIAGNTAKKHFIITADHGFIYKRDIFNETEKISVKSDIIKRRYIVTDKIIDIDGCFSLKMGKILGNNDEKFAYFPIGCNVFKTSGNLNYVHGGSSPQELIIPLIDIKISRIKRDKF